MSDDSLSPADLGMDLAKSFQPSWAQETDTSASISRMVAKHGGDERPDRGERRGKFGGRDRNRGPAQNRDRRDDRPRGRDDQKRPRRDDRRGGGKGGPRRDDRREAPRPEPELRGWTAQIVPNRTGVDGLAKQIKSSGKAYPLFDLARLVLERPERYLVAFKKEGENSPALFQLRADGSLWPSEKEAVSHALAKHLDKFYRRERVSVEPPKGNFSSVAVCGFSGELLGPTNHHAYQDKLRRIHAERFGNMSFEAYKSRVRIERDEASVARWKEEQSTKEVFYPRGDEAAERVKAEPAAPVAPTAEAPVETAAPEAVTETAAPEGAAAESPAVEEVAEAAVEPAAEAEAPKAPAAGALTSLEEVARHFRANHADEIVAVAERAKVGGPAAVSSAAVVQGLARKAWNELQRFPLPLGHLIGQQLSAQGVQIFKAHDNVTYVSLARPHYLDRVTTPVSEALSGMMEYLEKNPKTPRAEQWKALVALRPLPEGGDEKARESAVAADLAWLLHGGHVIDYAGRGLQAVTKTPARQEQKGRQTQQARQPEQ